MALLKTIFGKKNEYDDGQSEYFKEDFAPVVNQPSKKKTEPKAEPKATPKAEEPKKVAAKQPEEVKETTKKAKKTSSEKPKAKATKESERKVSPKPVERIVNPKGADAKRRAQKAAEAVKKAEANAKKEAKKPTESKAKSTAKSSTKASTAKKATGTKKSSTNSPDIKGAIAIKESDLTANGKWDIQRAKDGRFFFSLYASNHTVIAYSQIYSSSSAVMTGINSVITNAPKCEIEDTTLQRPIPIPCPKWEIYFDKADEYRFRLYAPNGLVICHSAHGYASKSGCKGGIESIKRFCTEAKIDKSYLK